jgi:hypothetical protein
MSPPRFNLLTRAVVLAIVLLAACLVASVWTRRERFANGEIIDTGSGMPGPDVVDQTCSVRTNSVYYSFNNTDGLQRHPNLSNACFFSHPAVHGTMDPELTGCVARSPVDHDVVASIVVEPVRGVNKCVVTLKPDLPPQLYAEYEAKLLNLAIDRSTLYNNTRFTLESIKALIVRLQKQRDEAVAAMRAQEVLERSTRAKIVEVTSKIASNTTNINMRTGQSAKLQTIINNAAAEVTRYRGEYDTALADFNRDNAELQVQNDRLKTTQQNIANLNTQIANIDAEINRLNGIIAGNGSASTRLAACNEPFYEAASPLFSQAASPPFSQAASRAAIQARSKATYSQAQAQADIQAAYSQARSQGYVEPPPPVARRLPERNDARFVYLINKIRGR